MVRRPVMSAYYVQNNVHISLQVRVQIFHSFVQSHLKFCALLWGFVEKLHIESLFAQQQKGMRAIMPGHAFFFYNNGDLPSSPKVSFNNLSILTVLGIITSNAVNFLNTIFYFTNELPKQGAIPENTPSRQSHVDHESCQNWYENYKAYKSSIYFKGPLLFWTNPQTISSIT